MGTTKQKVRLAPKNINKIIKASEMWVVINLDKSGLHYHAAQQEEGLALIALMLSSNEEAWEIIKEKVNKVKIARQSKLN